MPPNVPSLGDFVASIRRRALLAMLALSVGCGQSVLVHDASGEASRPDAGPPPPPSPPSGVDLLLMISNANSTRDAQTELLAQLGALTAALALPPCTNPSNATPHACDPANSMDAPVAAPVRDLHVGIVSSDLGTPGGMVPGCVNPVVGDDGLLNPIRNGSALQMHEPWVNPPTSFGRPTSCTDPNQFPTFIQFVSGGTVCDPAAPANQCDSDLPTFTTAFECNAALYVNGCGLPSQLEAVYRALTFHNNADPSIGAPLRNWNNGDSANAGFLRPDALLAILVLSPKEDGSVRDANYQEPGQPLVNDATDVYNSASQAWSDANVNLRFYMYTPGGPQDPTWTLDRYFDPANPTRGLLGLKPGHPERVVFAAITGVPVALPQIGSGASAHPDWNLLLGSVPPGHSPDDFAARDTTTAYSDTSAPEGPTSMRQADLDPNCNQRVVPACRRPGSTYMPTYCTADQQYFAWPARRIVEMVRRFDEDPICANGSQPCHNSVLSSVCGIDFTSAIQQLVTKIQLRLGPS